MLRQILQADGRGTPTKRQNLGWSGEWSWDRSRSGTALVQGVDVEQIRELSRKREAASDRRTKKVVSLVKALREAEIELDILKKAVRIFARRNSNITGSWRITGTGILLRRCMGFLHQDHLDFDEGGLKSARLSKESYLSHYSLLFFTL